VPAGFSQTRLTQKANGLTNKKAPTDPFRPGLFINGIICRTANPVTKYEKLVKKNCFLTIVNEGSENPVGK
jgi:hypothetical protein